ncbi:MAG TPA: hypothetical protein VK014_12980 [Cyclobacteriaceae bacterium]|nr:hypothetical protein [Cyclobacteriaceae bacterium]
MVKILSYLSLIFGFLSGGCTTSTEPVTTNKEEATSSRDTLILSEYTIMIQWGESGLPKTITPLDKQQSPSGYKIQYRNNGALLSVSEWKNGVQDGLTWVLNEQLITQQQFIRDVLTYEAVYVGQQKIADRLYPKIIEEFFFEDKYYAKLQFPFPFAGQIQISVDDHQSVVNPLPEQIYQLVVNDALDLSEYHYQLRYLPASEDTLLNSSFRLSHTIYGK